MITVTFTGRTTRHTCDAGHTYITGAHPDLADLARWDNDHEMHEETT